MMLEQAMKFKVDFDKMEAYDKSYKDYVNENVEEKKLLGPPSKDAWKAVNRLVQFLIIFHKATLVMSATNSVCAHKLFHVIITITKNISGLSMSSSPDEILKFKGATMLRKLGKYWGPFGTNFEMNKLIIVVGVLDPTKKMNFFTKCFLKLYGAGSVLITHLNDEVEDILRSLFDDQYNNNGTLGGLVASVHRQSQGASSESQSQDQFGDEVSQITILGNVLVYERIKDIYNEHVRKTGFQKKKKIDMYLKENVENLNLIDGSEYDVLSYWKVNHAKYMVSLTSS